MAGNLETLDAAPVDEVPTLRLLLDIDHFKRHNDTHGHPAGDELLRSCAEAWTGALRTSDLLARYGGEEFGVLLRGLEPERAVWIAERVRAATPEAVTARSASPTLRRGST